MIALSAQLFGIKKATGEGKMAKARHPLRREGAPAIFQAIHG